MRYRVEELAAAAGTSVDTVRYYQTLGLLPRPQRDGRAAWYDQEHLERLGRIRDLRARGLSLALIGRVLAGEPDEPRGTEHARDPSDPGQALALALTGPLPGDQPERLGLAELAERTQVSLPLLEVLEREGLLVGRADGDRPYTQADGDAVRAGMALLTAGVPLSELLALARAHDEAVRAVADAAVDLFARYVYDPARLDAEPGQVVEALNAMLPAAEALVGHHFRRRLLAAATDRLSGGAEIAS